MILYRQANENDFDLTLKIKTLSLREYIEQIWGWDDTVQLEYHRKQFKPEQIKIILDNNKEVGFIDVDETTYAFFIVNVLIEQTFQGQGIGRKVIEDIIRKAIKENKKIELQVFKINIRAKKLYEELGFIVTGETGLHYQMSYSVPHMEGIR
jgi:ribosomal protein S18 acetylase RimI-like enzyme